MVLLPAHTVSSHFPMCTGAPLPAKLRHTTLPLLSRHPMPGQVLLYLPTGPRDHGHCRLDCSAFTWRVRSRLLAIPHVLAFSLPPSAPVRARLAAPWHGRSHRRALASASVPKPLLVFSSLAALPHGAAPPTTVGAGSHRCPTARYYTAPAPAFPCLRQFSPSCLLP